MNTKGFQENSKNCWIATSTAESVALVVKTLYAGGSEYVSTAILAIASLIILYVRFADSRDKNPRLSLRKKSLRDNDLNAIGDKWKIKNNRAGKLS